MPEPFNSSVPRARTVHLLNVTDHTVLTRVRPDPLLHAVLLVVLEPKRTVKWN